MKGPHFFEKRKKEQARQQKQKEKAQRRAQRRAEKGTSSDEPLEGEGEGDTALADDETSDSGTESADAPATSEDGSVG